MEDKILSDAAARGDQEAFGLLVERHRDFIYSVAYKIALNEDDALDIVQNVYERLVRKIGSYDGNGHFRAWVATITAREAASHLRSPLRRETVMEPGLLAGVSDARQGRHSPPEHEVREALDASARRRVVAEEMAKLPEQQRAVFALRFVEDMRPVEIAERLGIPAQQVRAQLCNAIEKIRQRIAGRKE